MKKIFILAGAVLAMMTTSCSDSFLELDSPSKFPAEQYYNSKARMYELLVSAYNPMTWFDWSQGEYNPLNVSSDVMGDDIWTGGQHAKDIETFHLMGNYSVTPNKVMYGLWKDCYTGIRRCNYVMEYMPGIKDIDEATKNKYIAEATALRAWYYLQVWKFWGAIPYYTTNLNSESGYAIEKSDEKTVYEGIIKDLEDVMAMNALPMKVADKADSGHMTLATVYMMYADAVMYQNDDTRYGKALEYMGNIINSQKYSLDTDYAHIWTEDGEWNDETIFSINFFNDGASRSWNNPYYAGGTITPNLISPYGMNDGTVVNGVAFNAGWGFCPVREDAYAAFESGDVRRDASINDLRNVKYTARYEDTGFWLRKYAARKGYNDGQIADKELNYGNDLRIYRYSETLLNAAELILRGAGTGDAQGYFDKVRTRAGLKAGSKVVSIDNIIDERRVEFMGEGKRYFDLVRSGKAAAALGATGYRTVGWTPNKKYLPLPQAEINSSDGKLIQNSDY